MLQGYPNMNFCHQYFLLNQCLQRNVACDGVKLLHLNQYYFKEALVRSDQILQQSTHELISSIVVTQWENICPMLHYTLPLTLWLSPMSDNESQNWSTAHSQSASTIIFLLFTVTHHLSSTPCIFFQIRMAEIKIFKNSSRGLFPLEGWLSLHLICTQGDDFIFNEVHASKTCRILQVARTFTTNSRIVILYDTQQMSI